MTSLKYNTGEINRIESLNFDDLVEGSKFYKDVRIRESIIEFDPNIYFTLYEKSVFLLLLKTFYFCNSFSLFLYSDFNNDKICDVTYLPSW